MVAFAIRHRWTGDIKFTAEIDCAEDAPLRIKVGLAVKWAVKHNADLSRADLSRADLSRADLSGSDLSGSDLSGSDLRDADLRDADLSRADLSGSDLSRADLSRADLSRADLSRADLSGSDLSRADLRDADLSRADLSGSDLRPIRADLYDVLLRAIPEVPNLLAKLRAGEIDGSTYEGDCACLAGTVANKRGIEVEALGFADSNRPIERWFLAIRPGHTPENHAVAKITEGWIVEFMDLVGLNATEVA